MTLLITNRATEERGNGTNRNFYFDFPVLEADELYVYIKTDGIEGAVLRTDYSITGLGEGTGGSIYFTSGSPPSAAQVVHIQRWVESTQETDYVENDPFPAMTHENTLDRVVMMIQQTLQFYGVAEPGAFLMWDEAGTYIINGPDALDIATAEEHGHQAYQAWLDAVAAAMAARNWAGGALNTNFTYNGQTSKSAYHWATVAMVYTVFPLNTICWFGQTTAPIGWTTQTGYTDCLIGVKGEVPGAPYYVATNPWTKRWPTGGSTDNSTWDAAAISDNGAVLLTGIQGGRLYRSQDYGATWGQIQPSGNYNRYWYSAGIDQTGTNMIAASYGTSITLSNVLYGRLYTSSDGGTNWLQRQPDGNSSKYWEGCAISGNGTIMYACASGGGKVWKSINSGANWTQLYPKGIGSPTGEWTSLKCSRDGSRLIITDYGNRVWSSTDYGANWTEQKPTGTGVNANWYGADISGDGNAMVVGVVGGKIYTKHGGAAWVAQTPGGLTTHTWQPVAIDYDGSHIIAAGNVGYIYQSTDSGATWNITNPLGYTDTRAYRGIDTNEDGTRQVVVVNNSSSGGYVYVYAPIAGAGSSLGTWDIGSHTHPQTVHSHTVGTISISLPSHNHQWLLGPESDTYDVSGNVINVGSYKSGKTTTGLINEVTKANSRKANGSFYTTFSSGTGGSATGSTSDSGAVNTGGTAMGSAWRPKAAMGIIAKLTTIPTA